MNVSGEATTETTISGLNAATNYSIEVAAVNSVGVGVYSIPITSLTFCKLLSNIYVSKSSQTMPHRVVYYN